MITMGTMGTLILSMLPAWVLRRLLYLGILSR